MVVTNVSAISTFETDWGYSRTEDFWFIVAIRSEDEAEIRASEATGGSGCEGYPACVKGGPNLGHGAEEF